MLRSKYVHPNLISNFVYNQIGYSLISPNFPYTDVQNVQDELDPLVKNMSDYDQTDVSMTPSSNSEEISSSNDVYHDYYDYCPISSDASTISDVSMISDISFMSDVSMMSDASMMSNISMISDVSDETTTNYKSGTSNCHF